MGSGGKPALDFAPPWQCIRSRFRSPQAPSREADAGRQGSADVSLRVVGSGVSRGTLHGRCAMGVPAEYDLHGAQVRLGECKPLRALRRALIHRNDDLALGMSLLEIANGLIRLGQLVTSIDDWS